MLQKRTYCFSLKNVEARCRLQMRLYRVESFWLRYRGGKRGYWGWHPRGGGGRGGGTLAQAVISSHWQHGVETHFICPKPAAPSPEPCKAQASRVFTAFLEPFRKIWLEADCSPKYFAGAS